jgi:hypothetical protein
LILLGVFGTVVSLSIALIGASSLLDSPEGANKMGMIIGGMSSALSTTMTAIVCFVIYAYFYLRLNNARAQLLNGIETLTSTYLLPEVTHNEESMIRRVAELTIALNSSAERLNEMQQHMVAAATQLTNAVALQSNNGGVSEESLQEMKELLREGFRLPKAPLKPTIPSQPAPISTMPSSTGFQR